MSEPRFDENGTSRTDDDRAISTVLDVALALLLITASVLVLGLYLESGNGADRFDETSADRTAETLAATTLSIQYDVGGVESSEVYVPPELTPPSAYERVEYGPATGLLADAAVANARIRGHELLAYSDEYEDAVDGSIGSALVGADRDRSHHRHRAYAVALWEPYENASIRGTATAGERPPPDRNVGSTTVTVSSGLPALEEATIREAYDRGDDREEGIARVAELLAKRIVEGYFPPEQSQHALESQGLDRSLKVYHYREMAAAVDVEFDDPDEEGGPLSRSGANATAANERLVYGDRTSEPETALDEFRDWVSDEDETAAGLAAVIANDIRNDALEPELEEIDATYDGDEADERVEDLLVESIAVEETTITVQTWEP